MSDQLTKPLAMNVLVCLLLLMGCQSPRSISSTALTSGLASPTPALTPVAIPTAHTSTPTTMPPTAVVVPTVSATAQPPTPTAVPPTPPALPTVTSTAQPSAPTAIPPTPTPLHTATKEPSLPATIVEVPRIRPQELKERLDAGEKLTLVDTRARAAYESRHIPGALSIPLPEVEARIDELPRSGALAFY